MIKKNQEIFASSPPDKKSIALAKDFINQNGFTSEKVKIVQNKGRIVVVAKVAFPINDIKV